MSKFLNIVENSIPTQDLDKNRAIMQDLQRLFSSKGISSSLKTFRDIITITIGDKIIDLELGHVFSKPGEEDGEDDIIAGLLNTNDNHLKNNAAALGAKKKLTNAVVKVANDVSSAVSKSTFTNSNY
jgi:hypothetical protein